MPDHLHLFCAPGLRVLSLDKWVRFWKAMFSRLHPRKEHGWQSLHWDTRLQREESYSGKWDYVRHNPVRAGLVAHPDQWPYQGELNPLLWWSR